MEAEIVRMLIHHAVPLVSMWRHTRRVGKHGDQRDSASGDFGDTNCNISDQDYER